MKKQCITRPRTHKQGNNRPGKWPLRHEKQRADHRDRMDLRRRLVLYIFTVFVNGITPSATMSTDPTLALTARQNEILEFIRHALSTRGAPPTREEIARAFGFRSLNAS